MQSVGLTENTNAILMDKLYEMSKKFNRNIKKYEIADILISKNIDKTEEYLREVYDKK